MPPHCSLPASSSAHCVRSCPGIQSGSCIKGADRMRRPVILHEEFVLSSQHRMQRHCGLISVPLCALCIRRFASKHHTRIQQWKGVAPTAAAAACQPHRRHHLQRRSGLGDIRYPTRAACGRRVTGEFTQGCRLAALSASCRVATAGVLMLRRTLHHDIGCWTHSPSVSRNSEQKARAARMATACDCKPLAMPPVTFTACPSNRAPSLQSDILIYHRSHEG